MRNTAVLTSFAAIHRIARIIYLWIIESLLFLRRKPPPRISPSLFRSHSHSLIGQDEIVRHVKETNLLDIPSRDAKRSESRGQVLYFKTGKVIINCK